MEENKTNQDDYILCAKKVQERVEKELPILRGLLEAIDSSGKNIQLLPQVVHTLAVICPTKAHVFLRGADAIYQELIGNEKPDIINHNLWKALKKTASIVHNLHTQESTEFSRQEESCAAKLRSQKKSEGRRKSKKLEEEIVLEVKLESEYFQHVECDISSAIKSFIFIMIIGYEPSEQQMATMREMLDIAREMFIDAIKQKENALNTTKQIINC